MQMRMKQSHRIHQVITLALFGALLAGCTGNPSQLGIGKANVNKPGATTPAKAGASLGALPRVSSPTFIASTGTATVTGTVGFEKVTNPFFGNNAANYRVSSLASANALVTLSTLEEAQFTKNGAVIDTSSDASGHFSLAGAPTAAYVLNAHLVGSHRLSALAVPGQTNVAVNEISTAIAETMRWQLRAAPLDPAATGYVADYHADARTLEDLTASDLADLSTLSAAYFDNAGTDDVDLTPKGDIPSIEALKLGAGHLLRNLYVAAFGGLTTEAGATNADLLSDKWASLLGHRPLALTRSAGTGQLSIDDVNGKSAADTSLVNPVDVVSDHNGNLFITEENSHFLRIVVNKPIAGGLLQAAGPLEAGKSYVLGGFVGSPGNLAGFDNTYKDIEYNAAEVDPAEAPDMSSATALFTPTRLVLERVGATDDSHIYFTSRLGNRVFLIPGADFSRYGRDFLKGRLYTVAGVGAPDYGATYEDPATYVFPENDDPATVGYNEKVDEYFYGDEGKAYFANLNFPTGMALDTDGNVFVLDSGLTAPKLTERGSAPDDLYATQIVPREVTGVGTRRTHYYHGTLRFVSADTGNIYTQRLTYQGNPYILDGASDVRVHDGRIYVVHRKNHVIFSIPMIDVAAVDGAGVNPAAVEIQLELGTPNTAGFINTAGGALYPEIYDIADGLPKAMALLNEPMGLEWDKDGNMVVTDQGNGRVRLIKDNKVFTIAGGLDTRFLSGDARLAFLPQSGYINRVQLDDPAANLNPLHNTLLFSDIRECLVRRLHSNRGY